jgi:hypothetical protein
MRIIAGLGVRRGLIVAIERTCLAERDREARARGEDGQT